VRLSVGVLAKAVRFLDICRALEAFTAPNTRNELSNITRRDVAHHAAAGLHHQPGNANMLIITILCLWQFFSSPAVGLEYLEWEGQLTPVRQSPHPPLEFPLQARK
jgi:hypothetical protein